MVKIIPYEKYAGMYQLQWENGDVSVSHNAEREEGVFGFYSWTRANEIGKREGIDDYKGRITYGHPLGRAEKPAGEFK